MTKLGYQKLKAFLLTLLLFVSFGLLCKLIHLGKRIDSWKAVITAERPLPSYKARCEALGGVHARLHDATDNVLYDEICMFGKLPGEGPDGLPIQTCAR
jgi:hypothetical protein